MLGAHFKNKWMNGDIDVGHGTSDNINKGFNLLESNIENLSNDGMHKMVILKSTLQSTPPQLSTKGELKFHDQSLIMFPKMTMKISS
jgi:hypothetical protein